MRIKKTPENQNSSSGVKILFCFLSKPSAFDASLTSGFGLLLSSYGRFLVMFFFTKIADDTVTRTFSLKSAKRVVERFVFSDSDSRHIHNPPSPFGPVVQSTLLVYYSKANFLSQAILNHLIYFSRSFFRRAANPFSDPTKYVYAGAARSAPRRRPDL